MSHANSSQVINETQGKRKLTFLLYVLFRSLAVHTQVNMKRSSSRNATKKSMIQRIAVQSHLQKMNC